MKPVECPVVIGETKCFNPHCVDTGVCLLQLLGWKDNSIKIPPTPPKNYNDYGHALKNLLIANRTLKWAFTPEELHAEILESARDNLKLFGPRFIDVLRDNPELKISEEELQKLLSEC